MPPKIPLSKNLCVHKTIKLLGPFRVSNISIDPLKSRITQCSVDISPLILRSGN
jgi:hypothetical protein